MTSVSCCRLPLDSVEPLKVHAWMDALLVERLMERSERVLGKVERFRGDWERATFVTLARTFGFGLNGDAFERWAEHVPLQAAGKHRDHLEQVAAIFLGLAGFLEQPHQWPERTGLSDEVLRREWKFLSAKFSLASPQEPLPWTHANMRPQNFPERRIVQLARLFHDGRSNLRPLLEATETESLISGFCTIGFSEGSARLIVINAIVPLLYAYGIQHQDEAMKERALSILEQLPPEDNHIMRQWKACGLSVSSAADSQALIQLKREYCDRQGCLRCRLNEECPSVKD